MISQTVARSACPRAAKLSSRSAACSPIMGAPKIASAPGMARLVSLVVEGNADKKTVMQALREVQVPAAMKPALMVAVSNVMMAAPAHAGVLFDFNLTLPIIVGQFLVLMVVLDKVMFTPVGDVLDKRDGELRSKLMAVKDNSGDLDSLAAEASKILSAARGDATNAIKDAKEKADAQCAEKVGKAKGKLDGELKVALAALMDQKTDALKSLDTTAAALAKEIEEKILPA